MKQYTKYQIIDILLSINKDIDATITKYVKGCLNGDDKMVHEAKEHGFSILTPIQQSISCAIDFIKVIQE